MTLTCSAKGNPNPTFTWFKNDSSVSSNTTLTFTSINDAQNGKYYCEARNEHETIKSNTVTIDVTCEYFSYFYLNECIWCFCDSKYFNLCNTAVISDILVLYLKKKKHFESGVLLLFNCILVHCHCE